MRAKLIKTEKEYNEACERIYEIINSRNAPVEPDSKEGEEMELLSLLVEQYEKENYPVKPPDPVEAIKFRMEQMNLKQVDLAPLFGSKTRVSEILNRKRHLTLRMIAMLNEYLGIPLESLIVKDERMKLDSKREDMLLRNKKIKKYLLKSKNKKAVI